jgi:predicted Ser/Thr protein kinase
VNTSDASAHGYTLVKNFLGGGAFADVWEATDRLGRPRAIKLVRADVGTSSFIEHHAKSLAKVNHRNVVYVYDLVNILDPGTGQMSLGIVMDKIEGPKLSEALTVGFSAAEAERVGIGIIDGVEAIHAAGIFHNDLHDDNIIVGNPDVIIIDILYTKSDAQLSTTPRNKRMKRDVQDVHERLGDILNASPVDKAKIATFRQKVFADNFASLRSAFLDAFASSDSAIDSGVLADAKSKFTDPAFVDSEDYAKALLEAIPENVAAHTIIALLQDRAIHKKHILALRLMFLRLPMQHQIRVCAAMSELFGSQVPNGNWSSPIILLAATAEESWQLLPKLVRLRLENAIVENVRRGRLDIHASIPTKSGSFGTWSLHFWRYMGNKSALCDVFVELLNSDWYCQNYVAKWFLEILYLLAKSVDKEEQVLKALSYAYNNDARLVKRNFSKLPPHWQVAITGPDSGTGD